MLPEHEYALEGSTPGVVRVGDSVRRPYGPWVPAVHAVLGHLTADGFPAPRPLGVDELGREVVSWIPGNQTWDEHARYWSSSAMLARVAQLLRRMHDILDTFESPPGAVWRGGWDRPLNGRGPICHHDFAPYNLVIADDGTMGVIDWDGAGPGDRMHEIAYAICRFVPLIRDAGCRRLGYLEMPDRPGRIDAFRRAYGLPDDHRHELAAAIVACARSGVAFGEQMYAEKREPWASRWAADRGASDRADLAAAEVAVSEWFDGRP